MKEQQHLYGCQRVMPGCSSEWQQGDTTEQLKEKQNFAEDGVARLTLDMEI